MPILPTLEAGLLRRDIMKVYIAGPYKKGDVACNVHDAVVAAERVLSRGHIPYIPHLTHFWHMMYPHEIKFWYDYDLQWLSCCDCLLRIPGESRGADNEVNFALEHGIAVYYSLDDLP